MYVSTGDNDVFALDVDTGEILWEYNASTDRRAGNPFGRSNRGVALGEGRVFIGQLDAKLVALDPRTGAVLWSRDVAAICRRARGRRRVRERQARRRHLDVLARRHDRIDQARRAAERLVAGRAE